MKKIVTVPRKDKISLEERFNAYDGKKLTKCFNWDNPKGKEIW